MTTSRHSREVSTVCVSVLTVVIYSVDVSVAVDQLLHHSFHSKPGSQDQWSSPVIHASIQFCCTIPDQNLSKT